MGIFDRFKRKKKTIGEYNSPRFRVTGKGTKNPKVIIQCSKCEVDIRELKPTQSVRVDRAHFCKDCDPGVIVMNPPKKSE